MFFKDVFSLSKIFPSSRSPKLETVSTWFLDHFFDYLKSFDSFHYFESVGKICPVH